MTSSLRPIDSVEISVLIDNYTDLLLTEQTSTVSRPILPYGEALLAEHGLSFFITLTSGPKKHHILMDAGVTEIALFHNAKRIGVNLSDIEEICISHGHYDHIGSLIPLLRSLRCRIPVNIHPGAFVKRRKKLPSGSYVDLHSLNRDEIMHAGGIICLSKEPAFIANKMALLTGEIEKTTTFEQGSPVLEAEEHGQWIKDPFHDDQSLILNLNGKGLIVISGCAHAGIINSVRYAQKITGITKIHAVIGGFHLSGSHFKQIIPHTIAEMQKINPDLIIPLHCTGWTATNQLAEAMPGIVIINTVGTQYHLSKESK